MFGQVPAQSHKSHNAPAPYPTIHHSEQTCTQFCSEWCMEEYGTGALWDLFLLWVVYYGIWDMSIVGFLRLAEVLPYLVRSHMSSGTGPALGSGYHTRASHVPTSRDGVHTKSWKTIPVVISMLWNDRKCKYIFMVHTIPSAWLRVHTPDLTYFYLFRETLQSYVVTLGFI